MTEPQRTLIIEKDYVYTAEKGVLTGMKVGVTSSALTRFAYLNVGETTTVLAEGFDIPDYATVTNGTTTASIALYQAMAVDGTDTHFTATLFTDGVLFVGPNGAEITFSHPGDTITFVDGGTATLVDIVYKAGEQKAVGLRMAPDGIHVDAGPAGEFFLSTLGENVTLLNGINVEVVQTDEKSTIPALGFEFDAVLSFSQEQTVELTRHPIETGARIVDHTIVNPRKYRLDAVVTNTPLDAPASTGGVTPTTARRAEIFLANLQQIQRDARLVAVVHPQIVTREDARGDGRALLSAAQAGSFLITGLTSTATPETGGSVDMTIDIEEVVIVSTKLSTLPKGLFSTQSGAKDKGKTDPETPTPAEAELATSTPHDLFVPSGSSQ